MKKILLFLFGLFAIHSLSYGNITDTYDFYDDLTSIGIPMIILILPSFWLLLIPIILIESWVFKRNLPNLSFREIFWPLTVANLFSALIAIPISWLFLIIIEFILSLFINKTFPQLSLSWQLLMGVTIQAPWILPFKNYFYWMIPIATIWLLIPFYFVSSWSEGLILTKFKLIPDKSSIKKISWKANLASYSFLLIITFVTFVCLYKNFNI